MSEGAERDPVDRLLEGARADLPSPETVAALRTRLATPLAGARSPHDGSWARSATGMALSLGFCALALVVAFGAAAPERAASPARPTSTPTPTIATPRTASVAHGRSELVEHHLPSPVFPSRGTHREQRELLDAPEEPRHRVATTAAAPTAPATETPSAPSEVELVEQAHSALASGRLSDARRSLALHRSIYPAGMLTEERRSLEVQLRLRDGDAAGARAALDEFRRDYPGSAHLPRLERLVGPVGPTDVSAPVRN